MTDEPLVNPLSGEVLDPADLDGLRLAQKQLEDWLGHNDQERIPIWKTSRQIQELIVLGTPSYAVPRASRQTDVQQKLVRCPRCSTVLEVAK